MFILGTSSVLAFVRPGEVDLISPIAQVLTRGFGSFGVVANFVSIVIIALMGRQVALMSIYLTANARLPMSRACRPVASRSRGCERLRGRCVSASRANGSLVSAAFRAAS